MASLSLVAMAVCLCVISGQARAGYSGGYPATYPKPGGYPSGPYPTRRGYRYGPNPPNGQYSATAGYPYGYVYGPASAFAGRVAIQQGGGDQAGRGGGMDGRGRQGGRMGGQGRQGGGMGRRGGQDDGMSGRGGQDGGMGGRGGQDGGMGGRGGQDGGMGGRGRQDRGMAGRGGAGDRGSGRRSHGPSNPPDAIAFSGNRRRPQHFFKPAPVIFDDIVTNIGGGYNTDYGVFTAFQSGIYLVSYNVVSQRNGAKSAVVDLLRNKEVINSASGSGSSGETSNSAVLFLNRYDQLSVQGRAESAIFCGDGGNDAFCSFNVALLKIGSFTDSKVGRPVPGW